MIDYKTWFKVLVDVNGVKTTYKVKADGFPGIVDKLKEFGIKKSNIKTWEVANE